MITAAANAGRGVVRPAGAALAAVLLVAGQIEVWTGLRIGGIGHGTPPPRAAEAVIVVATTLPLVARRRFPLTVAAVVCATITVQVLAVAPQLSLLAGLLPLLLVVYSGAAYVRRPRALATLGGALAVEVVFIARIPEERATGEVLFGLFVLVGSWLVGDAVRSRQRRVDRAIEELAGAEAHSEERTQQALADERATIARELHDVIAHGVSVMGVQAAGARVLLDRDPEAVRTLLCSIEEQARESVGELQRLLGVLRSADTAADREPQPGLAQVPALVDRMHEAGVPVELVVEGEQRVLPAGVDLAAFRVVQEALTNVLKHAGSVPARVLVRYEAAEVAVEVCDDGAPQRERGAAGHGLIGMRERVSLYGGSLLVGPSAGRGFQVSARIPCESPRA